MKTEQKQGIFLNILITIINILVVGFYCYYFTNDNILTNFIVLIGNSYLITYIFMRNFEDNCGYEILSVVCSISIPFIIEFIEFQYPSNNNVIKISASITICVITVIYISKYLSKDR